MSAFNLQTLARPNILSLKPYRCARDDYKVGVLLDANELTIGPSLPDLAADEMELELNRYPDPHQFEVKQLACNFRNAENKDTSFSPLEPKNMFLGVGSDEAIDAVIRVLCKPGEDKLLTCPPTYGMYGVSAQVNDVQIIKVDQEFKKGNMQIKEDEVIKVLDQNPEIKLCYFCSPGNPTSKLIDRQRIEKVLNHPSWNGIVVVDEAYIDFAPVSSSMAPLVTKYPNLVVMQTLSKSFGLAGVRLGLTFASSDFAQLLNNMKAPYNISSMTSDIAKRALSPAGITLMKQYVERIVEQRDRLVSELPKLDNIGEFVGGTEANFLLVEVTKNGQPDSPSAQKVYQNLAESRNVVVRYRGSEPGCAGCLRISIGTAEETDVLLRELKAALADI